MFKRLVATAVSAAALQLTAPAPALAAPPIEAYGQLPGLEQLQISPDGQKLAFIAMVGEKRALMVRTLAGEMLGGVDLGDQKVREISWGDDGHVLVTTSKTTDIAFAPGGGWFSQGEYFTAQSYDVKKHTFVTLLDYGASSGAAGGGASHLKGSNTHVNILLDTPSVREVNGVPTVLVGGFNKDYEPVLFKVDPATGAARVLEENFGVLDAAGRVVAKSQYYREENRWRLLARDGSGWKELYVRDDARIDRPWLAGLGRKPDTVLMGLREDDEYALYEVSLATGARTKLSFGDLGQGSPIHDGRTGRLLGFSFQRGQGAEYVFLDDSLARTWASIQAGFKTSRVSLESWTPDFKKWVISVEGPNDAGSFLLVDTTTNTASKLGSSRPGIGADAVNEVRYVHYKAADGFDIPAYLTLPRGRDPKNLPLVVFPHGGPASRDYLQFDWWAQAFAARGYAVLQPQFRGSDGFGPKHLEAGYGEWGRKMQTDLSDGVRWLAKEGMIDPKRVCITGGSYGGYAAMAGPTLDPGVYRCAVAVAGVSDLRDMLVSEKNESGAYDSSTVRYWKRFMGADAVNDARLDAFSPARQAAKADAPILLIHGKDDTVVPYRQSVLFADALKKAGKPYEFVTLEGEDHWMSRSRTRLEMLKASIAFIEKNNPPG